jgi:hypothetical protein
VAVAAAGEEEGVRLEELARGGDAREEGDHAVERGGQRRRRRRHAGGRRAAAWRWRRRGGRRVAGACAAVARYFGSFTWWAVPGRI